MAATTYLSHLDALNNVSARRMVAQVPPSNKTSFTPSLKTTAERGIVKSVPDPAHPNQPAELAPAADGVGRVIAQPAPDSPPDLLELPDVPPPKIIHGRTGGSVIFNPPAPNTSDAAAAYHANTAALYEPRKIVAVPSPLKLPTVSDPNYYENAAQTAAVNAHAQDYYLTQQREADALYKANETQNVGVDKLTQQEFEARKKSLDDFYAKYPALTKNKGTEYAQLYASMDDGDPYTAPSRVVEGVTVTFDRSGAPTFINGTPQAQLNAAEKLKNEEYDKVYREENKRLMATIGTSPNLTGALIDTRKEARDKLQTDTAALAERMAGRYGVANDEASMQDTEHRLANTIGKSRTLALSSARTADVNRDEFVSEAMINLGKGIEAVGLNDLTNASNTLNSIDQQNRQIAAQNKAAMYNTAGQLLATAAAFYTGGASLAVTGAMGVGGLAVAAGA